jgi:hypothetical protein
MKTFLSFCCTLAISLILPEDNSVLILYNWVLYNCSFAKISQPSHPVLLPFQLVWNQPSELIAALLRFLFVPGMLMEQAPEMQCGRNLICSNTAASLAYIKIDCFRSDWALYVFVGVFSVMGGYIRTMVFTIGPQVVHLGQRAEVSLILNLGITFGVYASIAFSFVVGTLLLE